MKFLSLITALLVVIGSTCFGQGIRISAYPNTNNLGFSNLFIVAIKGSPGTNMNISWAQLSNLVSVISSNIALSSLRIYGTNEINVSSNLGIYLISLDTNIVGMQVTNLYVDWMYVSTNYSTNLIVLGIVTSTNIQAKIDSSSNLVYNICSNVSVALANTAMTTATNYTRSYAQPVAVATNYATNATFNVDLSGDLTVCVTNTFGNNFNVWLTNAVDRKTFILRCLANGSARTLSITNASGLTLNVINTNGFSVLTLPQIAITASKLCTVAGRVWVVAGTTNVDLWAAVQQ